MKRFTEIEIQYFKGHVNDKSARELIQHFTQINVPYLQRKWNY